MITQAFYERATEVYDHLNRFMSAPEVYDHFKRFYERATEFMITQADLWARHRFYDHIKKLPHRLYADTTVVFQPTIMKLHQILSPLFRRSQMRHRAFP